ncbi:hypothetical protein GIB67_019291 [Kingdonia uniflora]|uniref:EF-hand domain-containing protein n=1 Tax=Kingdonia uniflora TaxID=39325 RepID=A0A7J7N0J5_9MAGN|nr:hypothetical protein GIB67_019291 [Kingdonia uniflora]
MGSSGSTSSLPPRPQPATGLTPSIVGKPQDQLLSSFQPAVKDSKLSVVSGNGFSSDSIFGGDVFSATPTQLKQDALSHSLVATTVPVSSAIVPVTAGTQTSTKQNPLDSLQSTFTILQPTGIPSQSQLPWLRMTQANVQKYRIVFVAVDKDRDGKITGEETRNLFLSWNLPRVLDSFKLDSMVAESSLSMLSVIGIGPIRGSNERSFGGEDLGFLLDDKNRMIERERELNIYRSGSVPPTIKGSVTVKLIGLTISDRYVSFSLIALAVLGLG